jgi:hypothetical protein
MRIPIYYLSVFVVITVVAITPFGVFAEDPAVMVSTVQPLAQMTDDLYKPKIRLYETKSYSMIREFYPFGEDTSMQSLSITTGDINGDGIEEIIVGAGRGEKPLVRIFSQEGVLIREFLAYAEHFTRGITVTVGDINSDGIDEIVTSPNQGGGPHIRIFSSEGVLYDEFFAFDASDRGGVMTALGDLDNDNTLEFIVASGYDSYDEIKIFNHSLELIGVFKPFGDTKIDGISVSAGDVNGDGKDEILVAPAIGLTPMVHVFDHLGKELYAFDAYPKSFKGGVDMEVADLNNDNSTEIITGPGMTGGPHVRIFDGAGGPKIKPDFFVFDKDFNGGVDISVINGKEPIIVAATMYTLDPENMKAYKRIEIDLSQQKLLTFFKGEKQNEYLVSTGIWKYPTRKGDFKVYWKAESTRMAGFYGPGNPDNYDIPSVPNVMAYSGNYSIHGAFWHHNFGHPMSHGCINMSLPDAKTLYDWTPYGTPVNVY